MSGGMDGAQGDGKDIVCKVKYFDQGPEEEAAPPPTPEEDKKEK